MNEQSELSENELEEAVRLIEKARSIVSNAGINTKLSLYDRSLTIILTAAKRSQDLQQKLNEANARSEMLAKSAGGFAGERDALEQSCREKDELIERLVEAIIYYENPKTYQFDKSHAYALAAPIETDKGAKAAVALQLAHSKGYGQQKEK